MMVSPQGWLDRVRDGQEPVGGNGTIQAVDCKPRFWVGRVQISRGTERTDRKQVAAANRISGSHHCATGNYARPEADGLPVRIRARERAIYGFRVGGWRGLRGRVERTDLSVDCHEEHRQSGKRADSSRDIAKEAAGKHGGQEIDGENCGLHQETLLELFFSGAQLVDARLLAHRLQGNLRLQRRVNLPSCSLRHGLLCSVKQRSSRSSNQAPGPKNGVRFGSSHRRGLRSCLEDLADARFAAAKVIVLIQDNLSIHSKASLYEAFRPRKSGGWSSGSNGVTRQNTAAGSIWRSRFGVLSSQCLDRHIPEKQRLMEEVPPWKHDPNKNHTKADWRFTTATACIKLRHLPHHSD